MTTKYTPEKLQAFVETRWEKKHRVQFALESKKLIHQEHYLRKLISESVQEDYEAQEFKEAWQEFLIRLLENTRGVSVEGLPKHVEEELEKTESKQTTSEQFEKIPWLGSNVQLIYVIKQLQECGLLPKSERHTDRWATWIAEHFENGERRPFKQHNLQEQ